MLTHIPGGSLGSISFDHPNFSTFYEVNQHEGWHFIAMELLLGRTLKQRIAASFSGRR